MPHKCGSRDGFNLYLNSTFINLSELLCPSVATENLAFLKMGHRSVALCLRQHLTACCCAFPSRYLMLSVWHRQRCITDSRGCSNGPFTTGNKLERVSWPRFRHDQAQDLTMQMLFPFNNILGSFVCAPV